MQPIAVSLVVCTVDRHDKLERLFASLAGQCDPCFEVVLVDQNAPGVLDALVAACRERMPITHVHSGRGLSRARNVGILHCQAELIGFPDDDCWYPAGTLAAVSAFFAAHSSVAVLLGRTVDTHGRDSVSRFMRSDGWVHRSNVFQAGNSNGLFVRRNLALAVEGFDESLGVGASTPFKSGEETDFVLRCMAAGGRAYFDRSVRVFHDQIDEGMARARAYAPGLGRVLRLHGYGYGFLVLWVARALLRAGYHAARGERRAVWVRLHWVVGALSGFFARTPAGQRAGLSRNAGDELGGGRGA